MPTATTMLDDLAGRHPDRVALIADGEAVTYAGLAERAAALRAELAARGVRPGDVVGVWLPTWPEAVAFEFALGALGAVSLGIHTRYQRHEVAHLLRTAAPAHVVVPFAFRTGSRDLDLAGTLRAAAEDTGATPTVHVVRAPATADLGGFDLGGGAHASGDRTDHPAIPAVGKAGDTFKLFTTSGSTSAPKLAAHDQASVVTHGGHAGRAQGLGPGDVLLLPLPLAGVFGHTAAMAALAAGATIVLEPVFDAAAALRLAREHDVTHLVGGDDLFGRIKDAWEADPVELPAWRHGAIADFSGRSAEVARWAQDRFGVPVCGVYGSSEGFALAAIQDADLEWERRVRGGGRPVSDDIEVRVVDPESGADVPVGDTGELLFRGPHVMSGYFGNPEATATAITPEGWLRTSDLGHLDPDDRGYLYSCRAGDALRLRGFLVQPAEIEAFLIEHDAVATGKVVGAKAGDTKDGGGADVAVAFVVPAEGPAGAECTEEVLLAHCRANLAGFKVPTRIVVLDELPTTAGTNGPKVRTGVLRERAAELV
ncbi:AMP-binding protein [Actinomycetospora endophytica]|uniref:Long-chain-fatty-acid--CoA ligase n=1 Tax=Actinomycetospora endophytica TaxID=2291215 RepID=A0ABS8PAQ0_9PSEU|nr:AMP-binding protein [Actinomycetospora endophytica]MCD2195332.1 AMP-binding protein [Actinomycetospora endophytica]